jgi:hypothetical protein
MTLQEYERLLIRLKYERNAENERHYIAAETITRKIVKTQREKGIYLKGIDLEKIKIAESVLHVRGLKNDFDINLTHKAIRGIALGDGEIQKKYYGVKDYAGYTHQGSDCEYGYDPRHGEIVFSIGLRNPPHEFTSEEIECCLYYLNIILETEGRKTIIGKEE